MQITAVSPETGDEIQIEAAGVDNEFIQSMLDFKVSDNEIKKLIDGLSISADAKSLLYSLSKATIKAGEFVIKIGRKIIDFVCLVFKEYPSSTFGMIFGAIFGFLIASIPILGVVLGPLVTTIAMALGLALGLKEDIKDHALARRIHEINAKFSAFQA